jgi:cytochrome c biogenesis protein CcmG/thiol:disulfide interchange protein DsbE|tara:strand:- start:326 stop:844 length:519 start_codon:yes stop_codon:yes gene_type:complete
MKNKLILSSTILIFVIIFVVFYKSLKDTNIYTPEVKFNNNIPTFSAEFLLSTDKLSSNTIFERDKYYLLNIWASWCVPCRDEHSLLMNLNKNEKLTLIGMNYKDSKKNAKSFLDELGNPYRKIIVDKNGTTAIEWGAFGVPETFIIYNNKTIKKYIGPLNQENLLEIQNLIK